MKFDKSVTTSQSSLVSYILEKRKERQFQQTAELTFTFVFICFFVFFAIRPTVLTITGLIGEIKAKKEVSLDLKKQINTIIEAQNVYSQIQSKYYLIDSSLPQRHSFYQASNQVLGVSNQSGLILEDLSFNFTEDRDDKTPHYTYSLNAPIDFTNVSTLLTGIHQNRRLMKVQSIIIEPVIAEDQVMPTSSSSNQVTLKVNTKIYYLPK